MEGMGWEIVALLNRRVYAAKPNCCFPLQQNTCKIALFVLFKKFVYLYLFLKPEIRNSDSKSSS